MPEKLFVLVVSVYITGKFNSFIENTLLFYIDSVISSLHESWGKKGHILIYIIRPFDIEQQLIDFFWLCSFLICIIVIISYCVLGAR